MKIRNKEQLPEILTVKQVADYLNFSKFAIVEWDKKGIFKAFKKVKAKNGYIRYYKKEDLLNYVENCESIH